MHLYNCVAYLQNNEICKNTSLKTKKFHGLC